MTNWNRSTPSPGLHELKEYNHHRQGGHSRRYRGRPALISAYWSNQLSRERSSRVGAANQITCDRLRNIEVRTAILHLVLPKGPGCRLTYNGASRHGRSRHVRQFSPAVWCAVWFGSAPLLLSFPVAEACFKPMSQGAPLSCIRLAWRRRNSVLRATGFKGRMHGEIARLTQRRGSWVVGLC